MELVIHVGRFLAGFFVGHGLHAHFVKIPARAFGRRFDVHLGVRRYGVQRAGLYFPRLLRVLGANLTVFGDVEFLEGRSSERGVDGKVAPVGSDRQLTGPVGRYLETLLQPFGNVVESEFDFLPEYRVGGVEVVRDDSEVLIGREKRGVETVDVYNGGESQLPRLEYQVLRVPFLPKRLLRRVRDERNHLPVLVLDFVQLSRKKPPFLVGQEALEFGCFYSSAHWISFRMSPMKSMRSVACPVSNCARLSVTSLHPFKSVPATSPGVSVRRRFISFWASF